MPLHPKRIRPITYTVAVYLIGLIILLQIGMLISIFWLRAMVVPVSTQVPKGTVTSRPVIPTSPAVPPPPVVISPVKPSKPRPPSLPLPTLPSIESSVSHPALLSVPSAVNGTLAQINNLNDESQIFEKNNDLDIAQQTLTKAEDLDPRNPTTLQHLAELYYLKNAPGESKIYWQRLVDLGPGVGTIYALAKDHVLLLDSNHQADPLHQASNLPRMLYIDHVEKTPVETLNGQPQFHLRTVLMRKNAKMPGFDQKKLQPYVIFYQRMPDGTLLPDLSQRKGAFEDTFLFWGGKNAEPFGVDYIMPVPGTRGPSGLPVGEYYGFVIGIYYGKALQDAYSEPADLLVRMPLPSDIE